MKTRICGILACLAATAVARANVCEVAMHPDEHWWGLCNDFGREMPFTEKSDFACDLRLDNYSHQALSFLCSDKGRVIWCDEPVGIKIAGGKIFLESDKGEILIREDAGRNLGEAFRYASKMWFPPTGEEPELLYFAAPQYNTWIELAYRQNEKDILAYAKSMLDHGLPPGVFMIDDTWQHGYGEWEFDTRRFSDPKGMMDKLHAMGFKVLLWICPFVSMDSPAYRRIAFGRNPDDVKGYPSKGGFLMESLEPGWGGVPPPAAVRWWNGKSALLDFTHPNAVAWFDEQLGRLVRDYGVDGFKFDGGGVLFYAGSDGVEGGSLKKLYAYDPSVSPSAQSALYGQFALKYKGSEYRNGFGFAGKPVIMRLHDKAHSWDALRRLVPDMMAAGFVGCPFICPDMIGGGVWTAFLPGAPFDAELFIRSAQVHALCPMMQISASPWRVLDAEHQKVFGKAVELRQKFAPHFVELARESAKTGEPMMRNLEYCFPGMGYAEVKDEFMMGDNLLVAPVVEKGAKSRRVVIPPGRWRGDDGKIVEGPVNVEVSTPLDRLPHFIRMSTGFRPFVRPTLVPGPQSAEYRLDMTFSLVDGFAVSVSCPEDGAADWITSHVSLWFDVEPCVTSVSESSVFEDEGFELSVDERGVTISAKRLIGVKYAMYAFRQMAVPCRGTMTLTGWEMPFARISDAPKMKWRGFHFCGMRKFTPSDVEHFMRMAAYYRYNYFIFEDHGGFKSERYPWYSFGETKVTPADIRRLKAIADDLGISLVPAINCYGHSAKSSEGGYEHVALDGHPELQPLFEPDYGWNWCVTNPETRKVVKGLLEELLDAFGGPKYVHIGFDEANPPSCRTCASGEWYRHVADYLGDLAGFLREKGATAMVWHDQFLVKDDPRWFGFVHAGGKDAEKLLDAIPKDVIICDWYYGGGLDDYPTLTYFKDKGFRVFTSPWGAVSSWASQRNGGGFTQIAWAVEHGFDGAMTTTWGVCDGEDRDREFLMADFMWGHPIKAARDYLYKTNNDWRWSHRYIATHWRQVGWDMLKEARN